VVRARAHYCASCAVAVPFPFPCKQLLDFEAAWLTSNVDLGGIDLADLFGFGATAAPSSGASGGAVAAAGQVPVASAPADTACVGTASMLPPPPVFGGGSTSRHLPKHAGLGTAAPPLDEADELLASLAAADGDGLVDHGQHGGMLSAGGGNGLSLPPSRPHTLNGAASAGGVPSYLVPSFLPDIMDGEVEDCMPPAAAATAVAGALPDMARVASASELLPLGLLAQEKQDHLALQRPGGVMSMPMGGAGCGPEGAQPQFIAPSPHATPTPSASYPAAGGVAVVQLPELRQSTAGCDGNSAVAGAGAGGFAAGSGLAGTAPGMAAAGGKQTGGAARAGSSAGAGGTAAAVAGLATPPKGMGAPFVMGGMMPPPAMLGGAYGCTSGLTAPASHTYTPRGGGSDGSELTRAERVARYREKRKRRTFAKTIRYASRKAYAEVI
jgi:hypothetical protein